MARVYMHLDPHVYDRKVLGIDHHGTPIKGWAAYPTDALVAFFGVLALAELQPERGRFRSERILRELMRGDDGRGARYARQVPYLLVRGDLVLQPGGQLYVDGWDEWQEGNVTPPARFVNIARRRGDGPRPTPGAIRQRRYRERHREDASDASQEGVHNSSSGGLGNSNSGGSGAPRPPSRSMTEEERTKAIADNRRLLTNPEAEVQRAALRALRLLDGDTDWQAELERLQRPSPTARPRSASA